MCQWMKPMYVRLSNAGMVYFGPFQIVWRLPWLPHAAAAKGWDDCWRQMYAENEKLKSEILALKSCNRN